MNGLKYVVVSVASTDGLQLEKSIGMKPLINLKADSIDNIRAASKKNAAAIAHLAPPPPTEGLTVHDENIPVHGGASIIVRIYTPEIPAPRPVAVLYVQFILPH